MLDLPRLPEVEETVEIPEAEATEFALPIVDQALGFNRIAAYNYYPGWHQPSTASHMIINLEVWARTSEADRKLLETADKPPTDHRHETAQDLLLNAHEHTNAN